MSYPNATRVAFEALRIKAHGDISGSYAAVGNAFANPIRCIQITNNTDADMRFSFDGSTDHVFVPKASSVQFNYESNKELPAGKLTQAINTTVYVKEDAGAPGAGSVYVMVFYGFTTGF